jgi:hypothetical protein
MIMAKLGDLARLIRSKNAGPFTLTFDVMFETDENYRRVCKSKVLTRESFASIYRVSPNEVLFFEHDAAKAIKISIPRPAIQGSRDCGDIYGGQQHGPLVELEIPD